MSEYFYRFNTDELLYEICNNRGEVLYMVEAEEGAETIVLDIIDELEETL